MTIRLSNPRNEVKRMNDGFTRLVNELLHHHEKSEKETCECYWAPRVNVAESKDYYLLEMDLPGLTDKDVKITAKEDTLHIEGERKMKKDNSREMIREEINGGNFCRSFKLPENIDSNKIEANFKNGVLSILLHKTEAAKPKEISIKIN